MTFAVNHSTLAKGSECFTDSDIREMFFRCLALLQEAEN